MDTNNIISDGVFDKFLNTIKKSKLSKDKQIHSDLKSLNNDVKELEKLFNKRFKELDPKHKPIKLKKHKLSDFI
tara:strand:- start:26 stop:247 length:222 start_codon:yes stop_codon:yes gene_type:complete